MSASARELAAVDGFRLGVPLAGLVWDPMTAMDTEMARLDGLEPCTECGAPDGHCDHTIRYVLAGDEVSDGR